MLALLFDTTFWYWMIIVGAVVAIIIACIKYPQSRVYVFSFAGTALAIFTAWSGIQIDKYYNAEGGIRGQILGLVGANQVDKDEIEPIFKLSNLVFTKDDEDNYSVIITSSKNVKLEDKNYALFVNGEPSSNNYFSRLTTGISIRGEYHYIFKDNDLETVCDDSLRINFSTFQNGYEIKLTTFGGSEKVNFWNRYFAKNNMTISIEEFSFTETSPSILTGENTETVTISYYSDEIFVTSLVYPKGITVTSFPTANKDRYDFVGWSRDKTNVLSSLDVTSDLSLYAVFEENLSSSNGTFSGMYNGATATFKITIEDNQIISCYTDSKEITDYEKLQDGSWHIIVGSGSGGHGCITLIDYDISSDTWNGRFRVYDKDDNSHTEGSAVCLTRIN